MSVATVDEAKVKLAHKLFDEARLKYVLTEFLEIPNDSNYKNNDLVRALAYSNITRFNHDFIGLCPEDLQELEVPPKTKRGTVFTDLPKVTIRRLTIVLSLFHYISRKQNKSINIMKVTKVAYDDYRTGLYEAGVPIKPWQVPQRAEYSQEEDALNTWKKNIKPNRSDFREFKDENYWTKTKERIMTALEASGLDHLIEEGFDVKGNLELDRAQQKWLYKVFQDTLTAPMAKAIVLKNIDKKDTRVIWKQLLEHYDNSMSAVIKSQQLSTYLTSTRLLTSGWRGTHENFLLNFKDQSRILNDLSTEGFSSGQLIVLLNSAVMGIPHLSQVKTNYETSRRAAGLPIDRTTLAFDEYVALLVSQAQIYDASNKVNKNPRSNRQANMSEFEFDEDPEDQEGQLEVGVHDMDTTIDQLEIMQNEGYKSRNGFKKGGFNNGGPRKVMMNVSTWKSLPPSCQKAWDMIADESKTKILTYAENRAKRSSDDSNKLTVNNHTVIFEPDDPPPNSTLEVGMHRIEEAIDDTDRTDNMLLHAATHKTVLKKTPRSAKTISANASYYEGLDINQMMSQPSTNSKTVPTPKKNVSYDISTHETNDLTNMVDDTDHFATRGDLELDDDEMAPEETYGLEVNVHKINEAEWFVDGGDELDDEDAMIAAILASEEFADVIAAPERKAAAKEDATVRQDIPSSRLVNSKENIEDDEMERLTEQLSTMNTIEEIDDMILDKYTSPLQDKMTGRYKAVSKPIKMMDRIVPKDDGKGHHLLHHKTGEPVPRPESAPRKIPEEYSKTQPSTEKPNDFQEDADNVTTPTSSSLSTAVPTSMFGPYIGRICQLGSPNAYNAEDMVQDEVYVQPEPDPIQDSHKTPMKSDTNQVQTHDDVDITSSTTQTGTDHLQTSDDAGTEIQECEPDDKDAMIAAILVSQDLSMPWTAVLQQAHDDSKNLQEVDNDPADPHGDPEDELETPVSSYDEETALSSDELEKLEEQIPPLQGEEEDVDSQWGFLGDEGFASASRSDTGTTTEQPLYGPEMERKIADRRKEILAETAIATSISEQAIATALRIETGTEIDESSLADVDITPRAQEPQVDPWTRSSKRARKKEQKRKKKERRSLIHSALHADQSSSGESPDSKQTSIKSESTNGQWENESTAPPSEAGSDFHQAGFE